MWATKQDQPKRQDTAEFHAVAVNRVISTILNRLDESISLREMASVAHMSRFHFNRTFRQVTGLPPRRFLSALRLQSAARMLLETDQRVTDICLEVGYNSLGTFVRRFSDTLGVSPMRLRSMRRSPGNHLLAHSEKPSQGVTSDSAPVVSGRIKTPIAFSGPIFIGLFANPIPEGAPLACTIQYSAGSFRIADAPRGNHYLFAVGLRWPESIRDFFSHESALRGGGELICIDKDFVESQEICLRAPIPTDPPILVNLPVLLNKPRSVNKAAQNCDVSR